MTDQKYTDTCPILSPDERLDTVNEGIRLIQNKRGLTFGTDAYLLAAFVRSHPSARAVDLGSGTGIIPLLLLAGNKVQSAIAVEVQPAFAHLIERNATLNGIGDRLRPLCADVRSLKASDLGFEADLVVSNPPYMKCGTGRRNETEEKYIARHEVCGDIRDFCAAAGRLLKHGGHFVSVYRPDRLTDLLAALRDSRLEAKRMTFVHADGESEPSAVLIDAVKGASPSLRLSPPLFLYLPSETGQTRRLLTPQAQKIYDTCAFPD